MDTSFYPKAGEGVTDFNQLLQMQPGDYNQLMPMEQEPAAMVFEDADGNLTDAAKEAFAFYLKKGWAPHQAAALVGRLQQESGPRLNPTILGDDGASYGIGQWQGPRRKKLRQFAQATGKPMSDRQTQLEFLHWEVTEGPESKWGRKLRSAPDLRSALDVTYDIWRPAASREVEVRRAGRFAKPIYEAAGENLLIEPIAGPPPPLAPPSPMEMRGPSAVPQGAVTPPANALTNGPGSAGPPWFGSTNPSNKVIPKGQNLLHPNIGYGN